jgi:hypothetical protein
MYRGDIFLPCCLYPYFPNKHKKTGGYCGVRSILGYTIHRLNENGTNFLLQVEFKGSLDPACGKSHYNQYNNYK